MAGVYGSYDDPCHLWNDSIVHHYHFEVLALDVETLLCQGEFTGQDAVEAMEGHVLASASHLGTLSGTAICRTCFYECASCCKTFVTPYYWRQAT